jgi:catechol 2,3-dioxygenase-like lactoylglutathione lyase family enzyme
VEDVEPIRLLGVNIVVDDLDAMVDFLCGLGFELVADSILDGPWLDSILRAKDCKLNYLQFTSPFGGGQVNVLKYLHPDAIAPAIDPTIPYAGQVRMISLLCDDIKNAFDLAVRLGGIPVGEGTQEAGDFRVGYVMGPDNVLFMFMEENGWQSHIRA